jgi:hypothetical protein
MKVKTLKPRNPFVAAALFKKAEKHGKKFNKVKGGYVSKNKQERE